jgi:glycogen operon protein
MFKQLCQVEGFRADVDEGGHRFNPNKLMFDPYGKAIHRDHDWGRGMTASGPFSDQSTYGAASKSVVTTSRYEWNDQAWIEARRSGEHEGHGPADLIVYEVHLKGISQNAASNTWGVEHPGTYRGLGEMASYLKDLGVTGGIGQGDVKHRVRHGQRPVKRGARFSMNAATPSR